jgi:outer membrane protein assembly factor BamB
MRGQRAACAMISLVLAVSVATQAVAAQGWPQFRGGPDKTGFAPDTTAASATSWRFEAPGAGQFVASPISDGSEVIAVEYSGTVSSLSVRDGSLVWSFQVGDVVTATPAISGNLVVVPAGKKVEAIQKGAAGSSAHEAWTFLTPARVDSAPTIAAGAVFFGADDRNLYKIDLVNGTLLWTYPAGDVIKGSPAVLGPRVYFGSYDGYIYALDDHGANATLAWRYDAGGEIQSAVAVAEGKVFATTLNGRAVAVSASSGARAWESSPGGVIASSPAVQGGHVIFGGDTLVSLSTDNGASEWERPLSGYIRGSPAIIGDLAIVGDYGGNVYAHALNGTLRWSYNAGSAIRTSPAIAGGLAIVGTDGGETIGVPLAAGEPPTVQALAPRSAYAEVSETFTAVASDPEGRGIFYAWDFGDGTVAAGQVVRHVFAAAGNFTVTLTVSDGELTHSRSAVVTVAPFTSTVVGGFEPKPVQQSIFTPAVLLLIVGAAAAAILLFAYVRSRPKSVEFEPVAPAPPPPARPPPGAARRPPPQRWPAPPPPPPPRPVAQRSPPAVAPPPFPPAAARKTAMAVTLPPARAPAAPPPAWAPRPPPTPPPPTRAPPPAPPATRAPPGPPPAAPRSYVPPPQPARPFAPAQPPRAPLPPAPPPARTRGPKAPLSPPPPPPPPAPTPSARPAELDYYARLYGSPAPETTPPPGPDGDPRRRAPRKP